MKDRLIDLFGDGEPIDIEIGPNGELPPGWHYVDPIDIRGKGFREAVKILSGEDKPAASWPPADVVAWFLDARVGDSGEDPAD